MKQQPCCRHKQIVEGEPTPTPNRLFEDEKVTSFSTSCRRRRDKKKSIKFLFTKRVKKKKREEIRAPRGTEGNEGIDARMHTCNTTHTRTQAHKHNSVCMCRANAYHSRCGGFHQTRCPFIIIPKKAKTSLRLKFVYLYATDSIHPGAIVDSYHQSTTPNVNTILPITSKSEDRARTRV